MISQGSPAVLKTPLTVTPMLLASEPTSPRCLYFARNCQYCFSQSTVPEFTDLTNQIPPKTEFLHCMPGYRDRYHCYVLWHTNISARCRISLLSQAKLTWKMDFRWEAARVELLQHMSNTGTQPTTWAEPSFHELQHENKLSFCSIHGTYFKARA